MENMRLRLRKPQQPLQKWSVDKLMEVLALKFATQSSSVRRAFRCVATPGSDRIGVDQVRRLLRSLNLGIGPRLAAKLFKRIDNDGNGNISYEEFRAAFGEHISGAQYVGRAFEPGAAMHQERFAACALKVSRLDGPVSYDECIKILKERMATQHTKVLKAFRFLDQDHSGFLDKAEFQRMLSIYNLKLEDGDLLKLMTAVCNAKPREQQESCTRSGAPKISYAQFNEFFGGAIAGEQFRNSEAMEASLQRAAQKKDFDPHKVLAVRPRLWTFDDFLRTLEAVLMSRSKTVRRIFRMVDTDQSGYIDAKEFHAALLKLNIEMPFEEAHGFFDKFDLKNKKQLSYEDFLGNFGAMIAGYKDTGILTMNAIHGKDVEAQNAFSDEIGKRAEAQRQKMPAIPELSVAQIKELIAKRMGNRYTSACAAFREIDRHHKGSLGPCEFRQFLKNRNIELREEDFDKFLHSIDVDRDGTITYEEFLKSFGDDICGAPWESLKTGLDIAKQKTPHLKIKHPTLTAKEALDFLHVKLAETTTSVNRVFKRFNKGRVGYLTPAQFEFMFQNYNLAVDMNVTREVIRLLKRKHGFPSSEQAAAVEKPMDKSGEKLLPTTSSKKKKKTASTTKLKKTKMKEQIRNNDEDDDDESVSKKNSENVTYALFSAEFGPTISGESYVGVMDPNAQPCKRHVREPRDAPLSDPEEARKILVAKLRTHFKHNRTAFQRFNSVRDGAFDMDELRNALKNFHINLTDENFKIFAADFDKRGRGSVNFDDFLANVGHEVSGTTDTGLSIHLQDKDEEANERRRFYTADFQDLLDDDDDAAAKEDDDHEDDDETVESDEEEQPEEDEDDETTVPETKEDRKTDLTLFDPKSRKSLERAVSLANLEKLPSVKAAAPKSVGKPPLAARRRQAALDRAKGIATQWQLHDDHRFDDKRFVDDVIPKKRPRPKTAHPMAHSYSAPRIVTHARH